ncbi:TPA: N-acetyltransferase family protein [Enterobacter ludwigii]|uniref:GNAT family N-acetyltransferase n=1 Tax=Enterobacter sp. MEB024 TaxID=3040288 RepID=UPI00254C364B|nr:GNAT family N-acetyltransferase [Enterobacter sp. MEB024]
MMKLTIQRATLDDAKQLSEMGYASYRHHFGHLWESQTELAAFLEQEYAPQAIADSLMQPGTYWLIASAQMPVGFAKFSTQQTIEPEGLSGTLLHKLYLLPDATGHRYGEQLLAEVIRQAKACSENLLWLEVLEKNPRARRFYEAQGLKHVKDILFVTAAQTSTLHIMSMPV